MENICYEKQTLDICCYNDTVIFFFDVIDMY